jgi:hypothetical protein
MIVEAETIAGVDGSAFVDAGSGVQVGGIWNGVEVGS